MSYLTLKFLHVGIVIVSVSGFMLRSVWMLLGSPLLERRWVRIVPHFVDTALFASGLALAFSQQINPADHPWFAVKLIAIVVYILAGIVALRTGRSRATRIGALFIALAAAAWAAASAISHQPLPWV